jgi:hypothetical protein
LNKIFIQKKYFIQLIYSCIYIKYIQRFIKKIMNFESRIPTDALFGKGYKRACLGGDCRGLQRTPVDYAMKLDGPRGLYSGGGWEQNPHWKTNPATKYQPLEYGPVDLEADHRRLTTEKGRNLLYKQYRNDWNGLGNDDEYVVSDHKNSSDLLYIGDNEAHGILKNMYHPRFGPKGFVNTEFSKRSPNPYYGPIYGGFDYLPRSKLGD